MSFRNVLIVVGILLITPFIVKAEEAQSVNGNSTPNIVSSVDAGDTVNAAPTSSLPIVLGENTVTLHLDQGFVGHPVKFDLFDGEVVVAWDAKTLIAPTVLTVARTRGGTGDAGRIEAGKGIAIQFEDVAAVSASGTVRLTMKADRPPGKFEQAHVKMFAGSSSSTADAAFAKNSIALSVRASAEAAYAPFYSSGIMRSGLASWYRYKGGLFAASPDVPKGTKLKVARQDDPSRFVIVTVNDWGPDRKIHPERVVDLDRIAFQKIGNPRGGVLAVTVEVVASDVIATLRNA
jgi:hypothetical protein